ncbi:MULTISPECIES: aminomethyl-transferring glycine dehydrogenase [unclassified Neptuniibacter]|uniref:aminomethyl-transferring glycine dehydrogenase n=1 Tax=unclassified Neptuniibacter TaxID=2630693 RepID=UPI000C496F7A|nr:MULTISPECIES: aminomethyl-transferring glycine dehydrogenase [unclassified Neptuniibacter]MAY43484.1 glycine dehydrogenase (aminomethyl-transferring) [Oceanospirillaceae bacterium]|tara:strand:+ start:1145 stop:4045 length:2901 start_codon:yes stop_codon:yes gene_type:complete
MPSQNQTPLSVLEQKDAFIARHIGPSLEEQQAMLDELGMADLDQLITLTVPESIQVAAPIDLDDSRTEEEVLSYLKTVAQKNKINTSMIGMGYTDTIVPNVILRNVLENPGWYTAYTPYQPEVAQGRLEAILNFQTMVLDLTGLDLANASLLDEATAAAEAMTLSKRMSKARKANVFLVDQNVHPQSISVIETRAEPLGYEVIVGDVSELIDQHEVFGVLVQYPGTHGDVNDYAELIDKVHAKKALFCAAADIMSLVMLKSPGELGADVVFGSAQRFGVPMGYGGPHAAFFATRDAYKRSVPGRIIGVSVDTRGNKALRMAMQTREQHIRREKATSNICTAQVLLANMAGFYAVYHGPDGLKTIASRINRLTTILANGLKAKGVELLNNSWFDTLSIKLDNAEEVYQAALNAGINLRKISDTQLGMTCDECTNRDVINTLWDCILGTGHGLDLDSIDADIAASGETSFAPALQRESEILQHPVFNSYHSETEMLRYLKKLENKDVSLAHSMIALGSCTMKLNATAEMIPVTWPEFGQLHPFAPIDQAQGYQQLINELEDQLIAITGFDKICMQPNSGAQGEYAGLLAIRKFHQSNGDDHRNICLIPTSAHGTNPASAALADMKVVLVACDDQGNVDVADMRAKAEQHKDELSCLMITYPSTHGVFEESIREICEIIHANGGQVYMDGANLNAQVAVSQPAEIGADVSHMNLHKTFCIPHGGGGPGMGPIGVKAHLAPFVANHPVQTINGPKADNGAVSAAPWGSASILPISWVYIALMGGKGLRAATENAILNANYLAKKLGEHYPVLYTGRNDRVAHECIIDMRPLKEISGITEEDVAKRLMDFGFHAPTMSFPVAGTLMIEPTESESKAELDRFIEAMATIRSEISDVEGGKIDAENNPLKNAPHTMVDLIDAEWDRPYSLAQGAFPVERLKTSKVWPTVNRIDNVYGDRNLFCSCIPTEDYAE